MYGSDPLGLLTWRFLEDQAGHGVVHRHPEPRRRPGPHAGRADRAGGRAPRRRSSASARCPAGRAAATTTGGRPDDPTGEVTNEDYAGAAVRLRQRGHAAVRERRARSSGRRARWRSTCTAPRAPLELEPRDDERAAGLPRRTTDGGGATRLHDGVRRRPLPVPRGTSCPGDANGIGFEDLVAIEDLAFLTAVAAGVQSPARLRGSRRLGQRAGRVAAVLRVRLVGGRCAIGREGTMIENSNTAASPRHRRR